MSTIAGVALSIGPQACRVACVGQYFMDWSDAEGRAAPRTVTVAVQPFGRLLDPERAGTPVTVKIEPEDKSDRFGFNGIYVQFLLDLLTAPFRLDNFVPDRRCRAIPEPLLGGLPHRAFRVLADLTRSVLIEHADKLTHEFLRRIVAGRLRDRGHFHTILTELANGEFKFDAIAIKPIESVDHDYIDGFSGSQARSIIS